MVDQLSDEVLDPTLCRWTHEEYVAQLEGSMRKWVRDNPRVLCDTPLNTIPLLRRSEYRDYLIANLDDSRVWSVHNLVVNGTEWIYYFVADNVFARVISQNGIIVNAEYVEMHL